MNKNIAQAELDRLRNENLMLRGQLEAYKAIVDRLTGGKNTAEVAKKNEARERFGRAFHAFGNMTTKQHCAYQMLMHGKSNAEIAARMGVTESTAKVYVRSIMKKLGVSTRSQVILATQEAFAEIGDAEYEGMAGIPKNWDETWTPDDPYKAKYMTD